MQKSQCLMGVEMDMRPAGMVHSNGGMAEEKSEGGGGQDHAVRYESSVMTFDIMTNQPQTK